MANDGTVKIGAEIDEQSFKSGLSKLGGVAKAGLAATTAAIGAASAAVGGIAKASVEAYASYEQLTGGVETLFKTSSDKVMEYANNAYKTAGMSANEYMETVTSFSASLLQGLGGDTAAAADLADQAIIDMSDNANKMGTDISMIQNAYQGFAKQNYTMLDNLKLGYGGTQAEMARLINDSGVLGDAIEVTANTVNSVSFDKIIEAIHAVQTNMGITGTTALEAATTIEGSVNSMKSAWENFLTGLADGDQDIGQLTENLVNSVLVVLDNLVPRLQELLPRLTEGFTQLIQGILPYIPGILETLLPALIDGASALADGFAQVLPAIILAITNNLPQLLEAALRIIATLGQGLIDSIPVLIPAVVDVILKLVDILTDPENLAMLIDAGIQLILAIEEGILQALPELIGRAPQIWIRLNTALIQALLQAIPSFLEAGAKLGKAIIDGIVNSVISLGKGVVRAAEGLLGGFTPSGGGRGGRSTGTARAASGEGEPAAFSLDAESGASAFSLDDTARARTIRSLESAIPAAAERVSIATAAMAPSAAYFTPPPASYGTGGNDSGRQTPIIVRPQVVVRFDGELAQFAQVFKPVIDAEDARVGAGVQ